MSNFFIFLLFLNISLVFPSTTRLLEEAKCKETCEFKIVETIPYNVSFPGHKLPQTTVEAWVEMLEKAKHEIVIAAYKTSLQAEYVLKEKEIEEYGKEGKEVMATLLKKSAAKIPIKLVDKPIGVMKDHNMDGDLLENFGVVNRQPLDIGALLGRGIHHIKMIVVDDSHFYIGSANFDWRSLNQKMEIGVIVSNCPCLGDDARRLFDTLWDAGEGKTEKKWIPARYTAKKPFDTNINNTDKATVYLSGAPKVLTNFDRTTDLDAVVQVIRTAEKYLFINIMDYFPLSLYTNDTGFWDALDSSIRDAILRGVKVRMIGSPVHFEGVGIRFLKSLSDLNGMNDSAIGVFTDVQIKVFVVPPLNASWEVNSNRRTHNKFIVTEKSALIGTSNWSEDYFEGTTGASIVITQNGVERTFINDLRSIFIRDFTSNYVYDVDKYYEECILQQTSLYCQYNTPEDVQKRLQNTIGSVRDYSSSSSYYLFLFPFLMILAYFFDL